MSLHEWYRKLPVPGTRADRIRYTRRSGANPERVRKPLKTRKPEHVFWKTFSKRVYINGCAAKVMTRYGIAKFFDIDVSTVSSWARLGVLPEPFMTQQRESIKTPLYLASQIRCLVIVINELTEQGYVSIQWRRLDDHVSMLHDGYDVAFDNFTRRTSHEAYGGEDAPHGVILYD